MDVHLHRAVKNLSCPKCTFPAELQQDDALSSSHTVNKCPFHDLLQFSRSVMSNSLRPHGLQHSRRPCPSPTPGACSNSCPLSPWCHPTTSSSVVPFSCLQSSPASGSFPMSQFFASGGQIMIYWVPWFLHFCVFLPFEIAQVQCWGAVRCF